MSLTGRERVERRLAAILAADVVGYSRLMGEDEEGTLATLKGVWHEVTDPTIKEHRGRIVKTMGDGILVEFASVVDAVLCAVEVQAKMTGRNHGVSADRRIVFRIGINLGDIIIDQDDIFGDGVNIAARLEAVAEPGGICISQVVRDQVHGKLDVHFVDQGERQFKNIARPIRAFRIRLGESPPAESAPLFPDIPAPAVLSSQASENLGDDKSYFRLYSQKILNLRSLYVIATFMAVSISVVSLSIGPRSKLGVPSFSNGAPQSDDSTSGIQPRGPGVTDTSRTQPTEKPLVTADLAARSRVIGDPVLFEKEKVVLSGSAYSVIDRQAEFLRDNPAITVTVEGYCSEDEGARETPTALAKLRANQVRNALRERGVAETRIQTVGYGRSRPAIADAGEGAQGQSRRAVVIRD